MAASRVIFQSPVKKFLPNVEWGVGPNDESMCQQCCLAQLTLHPMKKSRLPIVVTAAFTLLCGNALQADSFTLLIYESKADLAARTDPQKAPGYWADYAAYAKKMTEAGILRGGTALPGNAETKTVIAEEGKSQETDKPVATSHLELGGYFIIEVPDEAAALEWARKAPGLTTGAVEVKRHFANPTMPSK